MRQIDLFI